MSKPVSSTSPSYPLAPLPPLPKEVKMNVISYLSLGDAVSASLINRDWQRECSDNKEGMWRELFERQFPLNRIPQLLSLQSAYQKVYGFPTHAAQGIYTMQTLEGSLGMVTELKLSPSQRVLAATSGGIIKIFELKEAKWGCIETLEMYASSLEFFSEEELLAGSDDEIAVLRCDKEGKWKCIDTLTGLPGRVEQIKFSSEGKLFTRSADGTLKVWKRDKTSKWECEATFRLPECSCFECGLSGTLLTGSFRENKITIWKCNKEGNWTERGRLRTEGNFASTIYLAPDNRIFVGSINGIVDVFRQREENGQIVRDGGNESCFTVGENVLVNSFQLAWDGRLFMSSSGGLIRIWKRNRERKWQSEHNLWNSNMAFSLRLSQEGSLFFGTEYGLFENSNGAIKILDCSASQEAALREIAAGFQQDLKPYVHLMLRRRFYSLAKNLQEPVYEALKQLFPPSTEQQNTPDYGYELFNNRDNPSVTDEHRAQAILSTLRKQNKSEHEEKKNNNMY